MEMLLRPRLVLLVLICPALLVAQDISRINVSTEEAARHLIKKVDPVYPEFARAAGIQGIVRISVAINPEGLIRGITHGELEVTGPPSLEEAAEQVITQYLYKPFEKDGKPAYANTVVEVPFRLPPGMTPHTYPLPALTFDSFFGKDTKTGILVPYSSLSTRLQKWFRGTLNDAIDTSNSPSGQELQKDEAIRGTWVNQIPSNDSQARLYVLHTAGNNYCGGAGGNCLVTLVEERGEKIHLVTQTSANGYFLRSRPGSAFPDVFFSHHMGMGILDFEGYANIGNQWGQLYCGTIIGEHMPAKSHLQSCQ